MNRRGMNIMLTEALVMICVLAVSASLCLGLFVGASQMRREARELSRGASLVFSAAQCYGATGSAQEAARLMEGETGGLSLEFADMGGYHVISARRGSRELFSAPVIWVGP